MIYQVEYLLINYKLDTKLEDVTKRGEIDNPDLIRIVDSTIGVVLYLS